MEQKGTATKADRQCTARSKTTGRRCRQPAAPGYTVCRYHGAGGGAPPGNLNALIHGAYVARVLSDEEQRVRDAFIGRFRRDFELNASSDEVALQMAAMALIQFLRAQKAGKESAATGQARIVRNCLRDLNATRSSRNRAGVPLHTTPAEWATALIEKMKAGPQTEQTEGQTGKATGTPRRDSERIR
jgi:hypothetical protein